MSHNFHIAEGSLPVQELGFDARVRLFKRGTAWVAVAQVYTAKGPLTFVARADEAVIARAYNLLPALARKAAQATAQKQVMRQAVQAAPTTPITTSVEGSTVVESQVLRPETLFFARLRRHEPGAIRNLRLLRMHAKMGNAQAKSALRRVGSVARVARGMTQTGMISPNALTRQGLAVMIARARKGDQEARAYLAKLKAKLQGKPAGSPQAGYYPFPRHHRAGVEVGGPIKVLHPARKVALLNLIRRARLAKRR